MFLTPIRTRPANFRSPSAEMAAVDLNSPVQIEPDLATCYCCGLTEECTPGYIAAVRGKYGGRWICGLCSEAVGDEIRRSSEPISAEEAVDRHVSFCRGSSLVIDTAEGFIKAVRQMLRRCLDSPTKVGRSARFFPVIDGELDIGT